MSGSSPKQPPCSILARGGEAEVLPVFDKYGMVVMTWSPPVGGWLSGRYRKGGATDQGSRSTWMQARFDMTNPANAAKLDATDALGQLAANAAMSLIDSHSGSCQHIRW